ncbi:hypothetical protein E2C01_002142 [Portunus trituberculatus]|uniref:Uncharacterized protein n=1 Tax=Portunus trituberculatus TaxID=210409 RepID=A0A5B7CK72_PORTR|nr:hypothetical protein [Portunus trituberculatus]
MLRMTNGCRDTDTLPTVPAAAITDSVPLSLVLLLPPAPSLMPSPTPPVAVLLLLLLPPAGEGLQWGLREGGGGGGTCLFSHLLIHFHTRHAVWVEGLLQYWTPGCGLDL